MPKCEFCKQEFSISAEDLQYYSSIGVPSPRLCAEDRQRRRAAFRNERHLYYRVCDATGRRIVSMYSPDKPFQVYDQDYYWSDAWDAVIYGRSFDFSRSFFQQFHELQLNVPRLSLFNVMSENSYFTNHSANNKNCYMCTDAGNCEDVLYSNWVTNSRDCVDCSYSHQCELCYSCLYCNNCYNCDFCIHCEKARECYFCYDCENCSFCLECSGLNGKQYYIYIQYVGPEKFKAELNRVLFRWSEQQQALHEFDQIRLSVPHRFAQIRQCEDCSGDYLSHCKNTNAAFDGVRLWDCKFMYESLDCKDSYDCYQPGWDPCELIYEVHAGQGLYRSKFLHLCRHVTDCVYCDHCFESSDLFGCVGVRKKRFCILNKQYSESEYRELLPRIINYLESAREWGEFFPFWCSPFGYNESKAQDFFPLSEESAHQFGLSWAQQESLEQATNYVIPADDIREVKENITSVLICCESTRRPFKIIQAELDFYRIKKLPIPRKGFEARYRARMNQRNPRILWHRACDKCGVSLQSTYAPDRAETIFCERCYLEVHF